MLHQPNHTQTQHKATRFQGFTLIELLVVIAIIAILAAILFPVFARARENARRSACQSNMKQIGLGFLQYAQDYDEKFPYFFDSDQDENGNGGLRWAPLLQPYIKSQQLFVCPSDSSAPPNPADGRNPISYSANWNVIANPNDSQKIQGGSLAAFNAVAKTVLVMETRGGLINYNDTLRTQRKQSVCRGDNDMCLGGGGNGDGGRFAATGTIDRNGGAGSQANAGQMWSKEYARHFDGANYLAVDGHVKWLRPTAVSGGNPGRTDGRDPNASDISTAPQRDADGAAAEGTGYSGAGAHALTFSIK